MPKLAFSRTMSSFEVSTVEHDGVWLKNICLCLGSVTETWDEVIGACPQGFNPGKIILREKWISGLNYVSWPWFETCAQCPSGIRYLYSIERSSLRKELNSIAKTIIVSQRDETINIFIFPPWITSRWQESRGNLLWCQPPVFDIQEWNWGHAHL